MPSLNTALTYLEILNRTGRAAERVRHCESKGGCTSCAIPFTVIKIDEQSRERLPGAGFTLTDSKGISQVRDTDENGVAAFRIMPCIYYTLFESRAPEGYQPFPGTISVFADSSGRIYFDGACACCRCVVIPNRPEEAKFSFTIKKVDGSTGGTLPGAYFELSQIGRAHV